MNSLNTSKSYSLAVDVTLDPDTAHPELILSDDGKQESCGNITRDVPDNPERFDYCIFVLGKEVQVKKKTDWNLGVARESVIRKGDITLAPQNGYWAIWLRNEDAYKAFEAPPVLLSQRVKIGVKTEDRSVCGLWGRSGLLLWHGVKVSYLLFHWPDL